MARASTSKNGRAKGLLKTRSAGYRHTVTGPPSAIWGLSNQGGFNLAQVEPMCKDYQVALCLRYKATPLRTAEVDEEKAKFKSDEVREFVLGFYERFWKTSFRVAAQAYKFGVAAAEPLYMERGGRIEFDRLKYLARRDTKIYSLDGKPHHVLLSYSGQGGGGGVELPFGREGDAIPPKAFWWVINPLYDEWYGWPVLEPAWFPWRLKTLPKGGGLEAVARWIYRHAFRGYKVRHPEHLYQDEGEAEAVEAQSLARQMMENLMAGSDIALSSETDDRGNYLWDIEEYGTINGDQRNLQEYVKDFLDVLIQRGIGIPDGIITEASTDTGSFAGRKIPEDAFYSDAEEELGSLWEAADTICRPLVGLNHGESAMDYEVEPKSLLPARQATARDQQQGDGAPPGAPGGGPGDFFPPPGGGPDGDGSSGPGGTWPLSHAGRPEVEAEDKPPPIRLGHYRMDWVKGEQVGTSKTNKPIFKWHGTPPDHGTRVQIHKPGTHEAAKKAVQTKAAKKGLPQAQHAPAAGAAAPAPEAPPGPEGPLPTNPFHPSSPLKGAYDLYLAGLKQAKAGAAGFNAKAAAATVIDSLDDPGDFGHLMDELGLEPAGDDGWSSVYEMEQALAEHLQEEHEAAGGAPPAPAAPEPPPPAPAPQEAKPLTAAQKAAQTKAQQSKAALAGATAHTQALLAGKIPLAPSAVKDLADLLTKMQTAEIKAFQQKFGAGKLTGKKAELADKIAQKVLGGIQPQKKEAEGPAENPFLEGTPQYKAFEGYQQSKAAIDAGAMHDVGIAAGAILKGMYFGQALDFLDGLGIDATGAADPPAVLLQNHLLGLMKAEQEVKAGNPYPQDTPSSYAWDKYQTALQDASAGNDFAGKGADGAAISITSEFDTYGQAQAFLADLGIETAGKGPTDALVEHLKGLGAPGAAGGGKGKPQDLQAWANQANPGGANKSLITEAWQAAKGGDLSKAHFLLAGVPGSVQASLAAYLGVENTPAGIADALAGIEGTGGGGETAAPQAESVTVPAGMVAVVGGEKKYHPEKVPPGTSMVPVGEAEQALAPASLTPAQKAAADNPGVVEPVTFANGQAGLMIALPQHPEGAEGFAQDMQAATAKWSNSQQKYFIAADKADQLLGVLAKHGIGVQWPEDPGAAKAVKALGGSTGAQMVEYADKLFVQKKGGSPGQAKSEYYADLAYQAMGFAVPQVKLYETPGGPVKMSRFLEGGKSLGEYLAGATEAKRQAVYKELQKGFVLDCLLGNWDVIGMDADNVMVTHDGKVWRIDNGGALSYRAQGAKKKSADWSEQVNEIAALRNPHVNPQAAKVFGGISDEEISQQIKDLSANRDKLLAALPPAERATVAARLNWLLAKHVKRARKVKGSIYMGYDADWPGVPPAAKAIKFSAKVLENGLFQDWSQSDAKRDGVSHSTLPLAFKQTYSKVAKSLPYDQQQAVTKYTGSYAAGAINPQMRKCPETLDCLSGQDKLNNQRVEAALAAAGKLEQPITAWRGITINEGSQDYKDFFEVVQHAIDTGEPVRMPGFKSCSVNPHAAFGGNIGLEIRAKSGAYIRSLSGIGSEDEWLQGHNVRYRVTGVKKVKVDNQSYKNVVQLEEI